ncbi:hypothetical protein BDW66DRAFT_140773 [Aspergillus desertorum]
MPDPLRDSLRSSSRPRRHVASHLNQTISKLRKPVGRTPVSLPVKPKPTVGLQMQVHVQAAFPTGPDACCHAGFLLFYSNSCFHALLRLAPPRLALHRLRGYQTGPAKQDRFNLIWFRSVCGFRHSLFLSSKQWCWRGMYEREIGQWTMDSGQWAT